MIKNNTRKEQIDLSNFLCRQSYKPDLCIQVGCKAPIDQVPYYRGSSLVTAIPFFPLWMLYAFLVWLLMESNALEINLFPIYIFFNSGSPEERGIRKWKKGVGKGSKSLDGMETYDLPFGMNFIKKYRCFSFLPISPTFMGYTWKGFRKSSNCRSSDEDSAATV